MCNELDRIAFCIWRIIDPHLTPTNSFIFFSTSFEQPPKTSMMMLSWFTLYSGYRFVSSSLRWLYFKKRKVELCCFLLTRQVYSQKDLLCRSSHTWSADKNGGSVGRGKTSSSYSIFFPIYLKRRISTNICFQICLLPIYFDFGAKFVLLGNAEFTKRSLLRE